MAQRRVSATGFGGASPGVGILQAVAEGNIARQDREAEMRRMAIQERLAEANIDRTQAQIGLTQEQTEQVAQSTRLAEEDAMRQKEREERERMAAEQAAPFVKEFLVESHGLDPSDAENMTFEAMEHVMNQLQGAERHQANIAQTRSSTAANIAATQERRERMRQEAQAQQDREDAFAYMGDQGFFRLATLDGMDDRTRRQAAREYLQHGRGVEINDRAFEVAMDFAEEIKNKASGADLSSRLDPTDVADDAIDQAVEAGIPEGDARTAAAAALRRRAEEELDVGLRQVFIDAANILAREPRSPGF